MSSTQQLKQRIKSVKSTRQITKAMQLVSASKMRKAQEASKETADYTETASGILHFLYNQGVSVENLLFAKREIKNRLVILIASDKGLAGAYNSNIFKEYVRLLQIDKKHGVKNSTITIGKKATQFVARLKDINTVGTYENLPDRLSGVQFEAILSTIISSFERGEFDAVDVVYTNFKSSMNQTPKKIRLLPAGSGKSTNNELYLSAQFEPNKAEVLEQVARRLVGARLHQALLDARASEHSQRMIAMKNATDNANSLVDDLTLEMNKQRQGAITQELTEISAGVEAIG